MINIVPKDIFQSICEQIKTQINVISITQSGNKTTLFFNTSGINQNNYLLFDCGDLKGYYSVLELYSNRIVINYSGATTLGTVKTTPFFQWFNLIDGKITIRDLNEFPLIYLVLPKPYEIDLNEKSEVFINDSFELLFIDKTPILKGKKTKTEDIYDSTVSRMSNLTKTFLETLRDSKYIMRDATFKRSEEIPFSITFSEGNSKETILDNCAGCYAQSSVKIKKQYNC